MTLISSTVLHLNVRWFFNSKHQLFWLFEILTLIRFPNFQNPNPYFENSPKFHPRDSPAVLGISAVYQQLRYIDVLFICLSNIQNPNAYFDKFPKSHPWSPLSASGIACLIDIIKCNHATFLCLDSEYRFVHEGNSKRHKCLREKVEYDGPRLILKKNQLIRGIRNNWYEV